MGAVKDLYLEQQAAPAVGADCCADFVCASCRKASADAEARIMVLETMLADACAVIAFYADGRNWVASERVIHVVEDGGKRARVALRRILSRAAAFPRVVASARG